MLFSLLRDNVFGQAHLGSIIYIIIAITV